MRIIYAVKPTQILLLLVCSYVLVKNREICHEKLGFDITAGVDHVLNTLETRTCENYLISTTEFLTLLGGNEPNETKADFERSKRSVKALKDVPEARNADRLEVDEETTTTQSRHTAITQDHMVNVSVVAEETTATADIAEKVVEKNLTDTENGTRILEEHKVEVENVTMEVPTTETPQLVAEHVNVYLFERPNTFHYEQYRNRSTKTVKTCVEVTRKDMVFQPGGVTWDILSCSSALLILLAFIILGETAYVFFTGNEFSQTGSRVTASLHIVLDLTVAILLLIFRSEWDARSAFNYGYPMQYPCGWKCVELLAWLMAIFHLLEAFFLSTMNGCIVFVSRMNSYNVAQREMQYIRTTHDEPLDGSCEW